MKKVLFLAIVAILFGCKSNEPATFKLDPNAMISIKPATGAWGVKSTILAKSTVIHLSALEIVKQTTEISSIDTIGGIWARSFAKEQRDTSSTPKLLMWATDVISFDGNLQTGFLGNFLQAKDVVFVSYSLSTPQLRDTIAYIPNATLRAAEIIIKQAYIDKNIELMYSTFNTAYSFIPITGAEWRSLKANNQQ